MSYGISFTKKMYDAEKSASFRKLSYGYCFIKSNDRGHIGVLIQY